MVVLITIVGPVTHSPIPFSFRSIDIRIRGLLEGCLQKLNGVGLGLRLRI